VESEKGGGTGRGEEGEKRMTRTEKREEEGCRWKHEKE
jgi:hypothetical protein